MTGSNCSICGSIAHIEQRVNQDVFDVQCPACGRYSISGMASFQLTGRQDLNILSAVVRSCSDAGTPPELGKIPGDIDALIQAADKPSDPIEAIDRILLSIARRTITADEFVEVDPVADYPVAYCKTPKELNHLLQEALEYDLLDYDGRFHPLEVTKSRIRISMKGWQRVRQLHNKSEAIANSGDDRLSEQNPNERRVFVVHGHDNEAKESVARFLKKIELEPIILHERPSKGLTVIEKIEAYSGVEYAVVLLTPDDVGAVKGNERNLQPRARQNVILELGYFLAKLGRSKVAAVMRGDIELPSDYHGVVYMRYDNGEWKDKIIQELKALGIEVDANKAFSED